MAVLAVILPSFEGGSALREGATHYRLAAFIQHLHVDVILALALLQQVLGGVFALRFVELGPLFGQVVEAGVAAENPGILVEHMPKQDRQPGNQGDGQPETGQDAPEQ